MEHKDRKDDRQTTPHCSSTSSNRSPPGSRLTSQTERIKKGGGKVFVQHSQHGKNCLRRRSASNLCGGVRKTSCANRPWPIYFMPYSLSSSSHVSSLHARSTTLSTCCQKIKKPFGLISRFTRLFPLHRFFFFFFCLST